MRGLSSSAPAPLTDPEDAGAMRRNQWVLVGTAGVLSLAGLSVGAMGVANAMQVRDAAGTPVAGVELRGETVGTGAAERALAAKLTADPIVAPSPTAPAEPTATASAHVDDGHGAGTQPAPQQVPAPAPVPPSVTADSPDTVSAASND